MENKICIALFFSFLPPLFFWRELAPLLRGLAVFSWADCPGRRNLGQDWSDDVRRPTRPTTPASLRPITSPRPPRQCHHPRHRRHHRHPARRPQIRRTSRRRKTSSSFPMNWPTSIGRGPYRGASTVRILPPAWRTTSMATNVATMPRRRRQPRLRSPSFPRTVRRIFGILIRRWTFASTPRPGGRVMRRCTSVTVRY